MRSIFLASCDSLYFQKHGPAFVQSATKTNNPVHIHLVNPDETDRRLLLRMLLRTDLLTFSEETATIKGDPRVIYATARYFEGLSMIRDGRADRIFFVDIDSIFRKTFTYLPTDKPVGLYLRDPRAHGAKSPAEIRGMRCLANCWVWKEAHDYLAEACARMNELPRHWFVDQIALYEAYEHLKPEITDFSDRPIIDWEFREEGIIWSGKGPRKDTHDKYIGAHRAATIRFLDDESDE